jgi:D-alanyl-D-alanine carboxypeptidase
MLLDRPPPLLTALSWAILDQKSKECLFGRFEQERREVASLTKIMTFYTVLSLVDKLQLDSLAYKVQVDESVLDVTGTSANLTPGDVLSIDDLLFGLMLPSGNDAAHMLALHLGGLITYFEQPDFQC